MSDITPESDEHLARLATTDQTAFAILLSRYEAKLYRYIRRQTDAPHEECEDILQEVFLKTYRYLHSFDPSLSFSTWIYRIAHNETISHFRKRSVRPRTIPEEEGELYLQNIATEIDMIEEIDTKALQHSIRESLSKLGPKYTDVLILRYLEEKSYEEISDILKLPIKTVGTRINRAKSKLKTLLS